jgi:hypothetical protein
VIETDAEEVVGINSRGELAAMEGELAEASPRRRRWPMARV